MFILLHRNNKALNISALDRLFRENMFSKLTVTCVPGKKIGAKKEIHVLSIRSLMVSFGK